MSKYFRCCFSNVMLLSLLFVLGGCQPKQTASPFWDVGNDPSKFQENEIFQYPDIPWGSNASNIEKAAGQSLSAGRKEEPLSDEPGLYSLNDAFFVWDNKYAAILVKMGEDHQGLSEITFTFTPEMELSDGNTQKLDLKELYQDLEKSFTESYGEPTDISSLENPPFHVTAWRTFLTQENGRYISNSIALRVLGSKEEPSKVSIELSYILMAPEFSPEQTKNKQ